MSARPRPLPRNASFPVALALAIATAVPTPVAAQPSATLVALSGTAAPAGGNYSTVFSATFNVNGSGQVAFVNNLTGGSSTSGVFVGVPGAVQAAALQGTTAPGGGNYGDFQREVYLNDSGQVAFADQIVGGPLRGLFVGAPGAIQAAALLGAPSPAGGNYTFLLVPSLNQSGQVAFLAQMGGPSTAGIFVGAPGAIQTAVLTGTAAPVGGNFSSLTGSLINGSGQIAFFGTMLDGVTQTHGVFVGVPGALQVVAFQGNAAPGGGNYNGQFLSPNLNGAGQVAFSDNLTGGSSNGGIFMGTSGAVQIVALKGTPAPAGGNFSSINDGTGYFDVPRLNGSGQVAFQSNLTGGSSTEGVFVGAPGALQAAALQGTGAPGGGNFKGFYPPNINGSGQVAFFANLDGDGVTTANDRGLYAGSVGGLMKVVRKGDLVDVDPGVGVDFRTVSSIGLTLGFSDTGYLAYRLAFADGSSGVFRSSITPVPEPASAGLIAAAGLAALAWRKRRRAWRAS